jgi:hypothetical protein
MWVKGSSGGGAWKEVPVEVITTPDGRKFNSVAAASAHVGVDLSPFFPPVPTAEQHAAERAALVARREAQEKADERAAIVQQRVEAILLEVPPDPVIDATGTSPARLELIRTIKRIESAQAAHRQAVVKHNAHLDAVRQLDAAAAALASLEAEVKAAHDDWHSYGSTGPQPAERPRERAALQRAVSEAQWRVDLSAAASDGLGVDVAAGVVTTLQDRLPALRNAVLVENSLPICVEIQWLAEELRDRYAILAALGSVTRSLPTKATVKMPSMPYGDASFEVSAADVPALVAAWSTCLERLTACPSTYDVEVPGTAPRAPDGPATRCVTRIRKAWNGARQAG